jgi:hypothetical protein
MAAGASKMVYTAMRPVRALTLVACPDDLDWRVPFIAALRAQTLVWGGQGNLFVPASGAKQDHPAFWAIAEALDPDAVLFHPGSWGDIQDLLPAEFDKHQSGLRTQLASQGFGSAAIDDYVSRESTEPWHDAPDDDELAPLVERGAMLHHEGSPEFGFTSSTPEIGYPWVSVLDYPAEALPGPVSAVHSDGDLDLELLLAATRGQFSSAATTALEQHNVEATKTTMSTAAEVAEVVLSDRRRPDEGSDPFTLANVGLSWFSRPGVRLESVTLVVGDDPWDFAVSYVLGRLTGAAYWIPSSLLTDPFWLHHIVHRASQYRNAGIFRLAVTSVSSPELAAEPVKAINGARSGGDPTVKLADFMAQFPKRPRRLLCTHNVNRTTRVPVDDGLMAVDMPTPELRTATDPTGLHWMTDVIADNWAVIRDSRLAAFLVPESASYVVRARAIEDGVSILCPNAVVFGNVALEAQVPHPTIHVANVVDQVSEIGSERRFRCVPSDKGVYTLEAAELLGGLDKLMETVCDHAWLALLRALASTKQSGHPGHWSHSDKRRYFTLDSVQALVDGLGLVITTPELVSKRVLRRGLRHHCPRCRFASWFDQEEVGRDLRCARCRRGISLNDPGWEDDDEPRWRYRLDELLWQFITHHNDLALRAVDSYLLAAKPERRQTAWGLGVEMDLFRPNGNRLGETDLTVVVDGTLWVGEAKSNASFGAECESSLKRLRRVAEHLRADGVVLAAEHRAFPAGQVEIARRVFDGARAQLRIVTVGET